MRNDAEKKKNVQREKFSQVATSPGAQRRTALSSQFFRQKSPKLFRDWINEYSLIQSQTLRILHF